MATRTDALLLQAETGKITCIQHPHCDRLSPGAGLSGERASRRLVPENTMASTRPARLALRFGRQRVSMRDLDRRFEFGDRELR